MTENGNKLWPSLLRAQQAIKPVVKDADNPFFKSKYVDKAALVAEVLPKMNAEGLVLTQRVMILVGGEQTVLSVPHEVTDRNGQVKVVQDHTMTFAAGQYALWTRITHAETGEYIEDSYPIICTDPTDPQKFKAAVTYASRGALTAFIVMAEEDDDGNTASGKGQAQSVAAPPPAQAGPRAQGSARPDVSTAKATKGPYRPPVAHSDDDADMVLALAAAMDADSEAKGQKWRIIDRAGKLKITGKNATFLKVAEGAYSTAELAAMGKLAPYRERLEFFAQKDGIRVEVSDPGVVANPGFDPPRTGGVSQFQDRKEADSVVDLTDDGLPF